MRVFGKFSGSRESVLTLEDGIIIKFPSHVKWHGWQLWFQGYVMISWSCRKCGSPTSAINRPSTYILHRTPWSEVQTMVATTYCYICKHLEDGTPHVRISDSAMALILAGREQIKQRMLREAGEG